MAKSLPSKSQEYYQAHWKTKGRSPLEIFLSNHWGETEKTHLSSNPPLESASSVLPKKPHGLLHCATSWFPWEAPGVHRALSEEDEGFRAMCPAELLLCKACGTCLIASLTASLWKGKSLGNEPKRRDKEWSQLHQHSPGDVHLCLYPFNNPNLVQNEKVWVFSVKGN